MPHYTPKVELNLKHNSIKQEKAGNKSNEKTLPLFYLKSCLVELKACSNYHLNCMPSHQSSPKKGSPLASKTKLICPTDRKAGCLLKVDKYIAIEMQIRNA